MGQLVRLGVLLVAGGLTYWKVGRGAAIALAVGAILEGVLVGVAFR